LKLVKDLGIVDTGAKLKVRFGVYICSHCGSRFTARTNNINSGNTKSCGCVQYPKPDPYYKSGMYRSWDHMNQRCKNPNNGMYKLYGGRGVTVCSEWSNFQNFKIWSLANGWLEGLSIDRIDPHGNYEPNNCRWANNFVQARNTRIMKGQNKTGFRGVSTVKLKDRLVYRSAIMVNRVVVRLGRYDTAKEAASAYNNYIIEHNLEHTKNIIN